MLGLAVIACASRDGVLQTPDKSTTDNATEINNRTVLLIPIHPYLAGRTKVSAAPECCQGPYGRSRQGEALEKHVKSIFGKLGLVKIDRFGSILRGV